MTQKEIEKRIKYLEILESEAIKEKIDELEDLEGILKARDSFFDFVKYVSPWIPINEYIEDICKFVDEIVDCKINKEDPKGLLEAPVRHMKSILISQHLPAYWIGRFKDDSIITASSSDSLLKKNSRRMEAIIRSPHYIKIFGDAFEKKFDGTDRTNTANEKELFNGLFQSYTVGSSILGAGANLVVIDDPFRNTKHAFSNTEQETVYQWYANDIQSRLEGEECALILMHQRLHENDLAGRIKKDEEEFKNWHYRRYQAIKEDGTALHEQLVPLSRLIQRQKTMSNFEAMYQQNPIALGGNIIKSSWFKEWDTSEYPQPKFKVVYLVCDTALKSTGDYWVVQVWGRTPENDKYLIDIYREQTDYDIYKHDLINLFDKYKHSHNASAIYVEDKTSGTVLISDLQKERLPVMELKAVGSKFFRLSLVIPELKNGYVFIPKKHHHKVDFKLECERFRDDEKHEHDDMVDCLAYALSSQIVLNFKNNGMDNNISDILSRF